MSNLVLNKNGATVKITNNSNIVYNYDYDNGIISPTIIDNITSEIDEIRPFNIKIPSFVTYRETTLQPGDSITFETDNVDEILYYSNLSTSLIPGISVTVTPNGSGGEVISEKTVKFIDYDGTLLYSYTPDEFNALTTMPENPIHSGLTSQGWNWSLSDAKSYVSDYGLLTIGQTYITNDGKTRLYIFIEDSETEGAIKIGLNGTVIIDWGDYSSTETIVGSDIDTTIQKTHMYYNPGKYTITLDITDGNVSLNGISNFWLGKIEIGSGVISIADNAFSECEWLNTITIPKEITYIGDSAFRECCALTSITIPDGITTLKSSVLNICFGLTSISLPNTITSIEDNALSICPALTSIAIPNTITSISDEAFSYCQGLTNIIIPNGITEIGKEAFYECYALKYVSIPETVTTIGQAAFSNCFALDSITIPETVTFISNGAFAYCQSLNSFTIPNNITSIELATFSCCSALSSIIIPENITYIDASAFSYCRKLTSITFISSTPPTLNSTAFEMISPFGTMYIPEGSLEAYTTAENYPEPEFYNYVEY